MSYRLYLVLFALMVLPSFSPSIWGGGVIVNATKPMQPPEWALLERELLRANAAACEEFYAHYFDERGYLLCIERWGGDDGPDDAIESCNDWPHLHALGGNDRVLTLYKKAWEGRAGAHFA